MLKAGHYTDLLRQVNELKRQLHLVEAERKACEDEGNETIKRNQQRLNRLKQDVGDIKAELSDAVRHTRQNQPMQSSQMGIIQLLKENNIDYSKYKLTKTAQEILTDLDWRIADIVKQADLTKHEIYLIYQRVNQIDEQLALDQPTRTESPIPTLSSAGSSLITSKTTPLAMTKMMNEQATLTEIQSIRQKMAEAYHIQRQYKTILDVISGERIGYDSQLTDLEKAIVESKTEVAKLKDVREAAKRARDVAKTELQHHEETLVASTRETDRLLSDYKRRIDEMKSSANASNRKQTPLTTSRITQQPAGGSAGVLRPSGTTVPSSASGTAAAGGVADGVSIADAEDRLLLHETKKAIDHLKSVTGAADVRSTIRIVDSQKEKCDELRQQFHVLQERLQYLTQLKESLLTRLNQLIEAQAMSINNSGRPTPRCVEADPSHQQEDVGSSNDYRNHEPEEQDQMDYNEALASLASVITKISIQIPFGPPVEEANYPTQSASMADHLNVLNLLENKLSSLMELVKSLDAIKAEPTTVNSNPNNNPDLLYSQVGQLSLPSSPRLPGVMEQTLNLMQSIDPSSGVASTLAVAVATDRAGRPVNSKLRGNESGSDEDQVPTRGFLKRQTRIIVEAKTKKQNQRPRKGD